MVFQNGVKIIQAAAYNGTRTVYMNVTPSLLSLIVYCNAFNNA